MLQVEEIVSVTKLYSKNHNDYKLNIRIKKKKRWIKRRKRMIFASRVPLFFTFNVMEIVKKCFSFALDFDYLCIYIFCE